MILQLFTKPSYAYTVAYHLLDSSMPVSGYHGAVCKVFDPEQRELLEQRLSARTESWCDIYRVLDYHFTSRYDALGAHNAMKAICIHGIANLVLTYFTATTDIYSAHVNSRPGTSRLHENRGLCPGQHGLRLQPLCGLGKKSQR